MKELPSIKSNFTIKTTVTTQQTKKAPLSCEKEASYLMDYLITYFPKP